MLNDQTMKEVYAPFISIVSAPSSCVTPLGKMILEADVDLTARLLFMQKMHKTHPGTGAVCTAAAIRIPGSIPHRLLRRSTDKPPDASPRSAPSGCRRCGCWH